MTPPGMVQRFDAWTAECRECGLSWCGFVDDVDRFCEFHSCPVLPVVVDPDQLSLL